MLCKIVHTIATSYFITTKFCNYDYIPFAVYHTYYITPGENEYSQNFSNEMSYSVEPKPLSQVTITTYVHIIYCTYYTARLCRS